jgi:hypothetical protein
MAHKVRPGVGAPGAVGNADTGDGQHLTVTQPPSKASYKYAEVAACIELLAETFPLAFSIYEARRRPLKVGIHLDILKALDGAITPIELGRRVELHHSPQGEPVMSRHGEGLEAARETLAEFGIVPRVVSQRPHVKIRWEIGCRKFQYSMAVSPSDCRTSMNIRAGNSAPDQD